VLLKILELFFPKKQLAATDELYNATILVNKYEKDISKEFTAQFLPCQQYFRSDLKNILTVSQV
jgi:hypothetical protein